METLKFIQVLRVISVYFNLNYSTLEYYTYMKSYKKEMKVIKQNTVIFDLDGCIANSDDFIITKLQAYNTNKEFYKKPLKSEETDFSEEYFYTNQEKVLPYFGIFNLFVQLAMQTSVIILTSRFDMYRGKTINWLKNNVIKYYDEFTWRQINYKLYMNENKLKSLQHKKTMINFIEETNNINLVIEDHPEVIEWLKSKKIDVLVPATGYKNLNGKDISKELTKRKRNNGM